MSPFQIQGYLILFLFVLPVLLLAQTDCVIPDRQAELDVNNVRVRLLNAGDLWWDRSEARYIVPKVLPGQGPEVAAIFAGGLWIGGYDTTGTLRLAAQTYGSTSDRGDYAAGPLNDNGQTERNWCNNFNRIFRVTKADIDALRADWEDNGTIDSVLSGDIKGWPAKGNPHFFDQYRFTLPDLELAPFFDRDQNGLFEPMKGDYPEVKEADQAFWMVFNDVGRQHNNSNGAKIGMEIHLLAYAYQSTNPSINDATFYEYTFINKSGQRIDSMYATLWVDGDLGCHTDDYVGCSPGRDLAYIYNMDAVDGATDCSCAGGVNTYCRDIPVVGIKILDGVQSGRVRDDAGNLRFPARTEEPDTFIDAGLSKLMYYQNSQWGGSYPAAALDPSTPQEYYNYMSGSWRDGRPLTQGGNGYNPNSSLTTSHAFTDNPAQGGGWSMCGINARPGDPRLVMSSGPFRMESGSTNRLSFAVIFKADVAYPCPDISVLEQVADDVHFFYDGTVYTSLQEPTAQEEVIHLYPNPMRSESIMELRAAGLLFRAINIFNSQGALVRTYTNLSGTSHSIDRKGLEGGLYFYQARLSNGQVVGGKMGVE